MAYIKPKQNPNSPCLLSEIRKEVIEDPNYFASPVFEGKTLFKCDSVLQSEHYADPEYTTLLESLDNPEDMFSVYDEEALYMVTGNVFDAINAKEIEWEELCAIV